MRGRCHMPRMSLCGSRFAHAFLPMATRPPATVRRWLLAALVIAQVSIVLLIIRNWFYVTTYRLFLDQRVEDVHRSTAVQRFEVDERRILPQIATRDAERIAFASAINRPSTIHVGVRADDRARYEVHFRHGGRDDLLARGDAASSALAVAAPVPAGPGVIELVGDRALTWIDPHLVRDLDAAPHGTALAVLLIISLSLIRRRPKHAAARATPPAWLKPCASCVSIVFALLTIEGALRLLGDRVPPGLAAERHDLGEVRRASRWEDSPRFERRMRPNVDAINAGR